MGGNITKNVEVRPHGQTDLRLIYYFLLTKNERRKIHTTVQYKHAVSATQILLYFRAIKEEHTNYIKHNLDLQTFLI